MVLSVRSVNPILSAEGSLKSTLLKMKVSLHVFMVRCSCRAAAVVIFPSFSAAARIGNLLGVAPAKRRVIYHGLDTEFWIDRQTERAKLPRELSPGRYLLFASKLYPFKRAPLLLDAFRIWRRRHGRNDIRLVLCGEELDSPETTEIRAKITALGLTSEVYLAGVVDRPLLRTLYRHAGVFVLPTVLETFGFPYVEAMASGIPLVCADIDIARELCGDAAYYFRADDTEDLVAAMEHAMTDPERARKLAGGFDRAREFSWRKEAQNTLECLREAAARQDRGTVTVPA
jgi:glycosyltransferase involved in cell wall biosynthesis